MKFTMTPERPGLLAISLAILILGTLVSTAWVELLHVDGVPGQGEGLGLLMIMGLLISWGTSIVVGALAWNGVWRPVCFAAAEALLIALVVASFIAYEEANHPPRPNPPPDSQGPPPITIVPRDRIDEQYVQAGGDATLLRLVEAGDMGGVDARLRDIRVDVADAALGSLPMVRAYGLNRADIAALFRSRGIGFEDAIALGLRTRDTEALERMFKDGADINHPLKNGLAPLIVAAQDRDERVMIPFLLDHGADKDAMTSDRDTALHIVVKARDVEAARALLSNGGRLDFQNAQGITPRQMMKQMNDTDMIQMVTRLQGIAP